MGYSREYLRAPQKANKSLATLAPEEGNNRYAGRARLSASFSNRERLSVIVAHILLP
jgi:hypothetical protein